MCGIAGKVNLGSGFVKKTDLTAMCEAIAHRGPDDSGEFVSEDKKLGLGHRRLSIIDLSRRGHQPMTYKNRYTIVFNGEVYNYKTEKAKLQKLDYKFKTKTDTEVLLALYDRYGVNCLSHLRGFFAFAIYDRIKNTLFLARDRIGKKPLKYYFNKNVFIFSSELKAIITQPEVNKVPDLIAINNYLTFGYITAPFTGFEEIYKLEPGNYMILNISDGTLTKKRYWHPDFSEKIYLSESEWKEKILDSLEESVKYRMVSDVPIGAFLSGGVDSSAVVALMSKNSMEKVKTFTIGFKEKKYDESEYAKVIAKMYNTDHHEFIVEPESVDLLPDLVHQYEEPYANSSNIIAYLVSKIARKYVKVVLNGDCSDEIFGGYDRYVRVKRDSYIEYIKTLLSQGKLITGPLRKLVKNGLIKRADNIFSKIGLDFEEKYLSYIAFFNNSDKERLYSYDYWSKVNYFDSVGIIRQKFEEAGNVSFPDKVMYFDLTTYFPDDLLTKVDIASMKVGLEARSPFIDHELIDLVGKIPFNLKVKGKGELKYILKKSLEDIVPKGNLYRKKMGFSLPLDKWFTGDLRKYAKDVLLSKKANSRGMFNNNYIRMMLSKHSEKNDFGNKLWALLTLELWFRSYFD